MHDRVARPTGAGKTAATIAIEIMILLCIGLRIAQVRPRVEESVQRLLVLLSRRVHFRLLLSKHFARKKIMILLLGENYEN